MSYVVRRTQGTPFNIDDLGVPIPASSSYDLYLDAGIPFETIFRSVAHGDLKTALDDGELEVLDAPGGNPVTPADALFNAVQTHAKTHMADGSDPLDVTGLTGTLADPQTPAAHGHVAAEVSDFQAAVSANTQVQQAFTHSNQTGNPHNANTDQISEGSNNLYYTEGRVNLNPSVQANSVHRNQTGNPHNTVTDDISEGSTNLWFTTTRVNQTPAVQNATNHIANTGNPHSTSLANLQAGTFAHLQALVSDATLDQAGDPRPPTAHTHTASQITDFDTAVAAVSEVVAAFNHAGITSGNPHGTTAADVGAIPAAEKGAANGVATLDATGKIPVGQIPASAIPELFVVADATARLALTVQQGDEAIQLDDGSQWIYDGSAWIARPNPTQGVTNGGTSTDNAVARFDGATGQVIQDSDVTVDDDGRLTAKRLTVQPVAPGTFGHLGLVVDHTLLGDPYNLGLNPTDPGRIYMTCEDGSLRQASVWSHDAFGGNTIFGVSRSTNAGSTWQPLFVVRENGRVGINKNNPSQALDIVGNITLTGNITLNGTVDGVDIAQQDTLNTNHRNATNNPHSTSLANLQQGTLADLNNLLTDATLDQAGDPRPPTSHTHVAAQVTDFDTAVRAVAIGNNPGTVNAFTPKAVPVASDLLVIDDSEDGFAKKKVSLQAFLDQLDRTEWFSAYDSVGGAGTAASSWVDVPLDTETATSAGFTHTGSNPDVTVNESFMYVIFARVSLRMSNNSRSSSEIRLLRDTGSGFQEIPGTLGYGYHRQTAQDESTAVTFGAFFLNQGDRIKVQHRRIAGSTTLRTKAGGSTLLIGKIKGIKGDPGPAGPSGVGTVQLLRNGTPIGSFGSVNLLGAAVQSVVDAGSGQVNVTVNPFGTAPPYEEALAATSTTSTTTWEQKVLMNRTLEAGTYRVRWYTEVLTQNYFDGVDVRILLAENSTIAGGTPDTLASTQRYGPLAFGFTGANAWREVEGWARITLVQGVSELAIEFKASAGANGGIVSMRNAKLELERIG